MYVVCSSEFAMEIILNFNIQLETSCKSECEATAAVVLFDECYAKCESRVEAERRSVLVDATRALGADVIDTRSDSSESGDDDDRRGRPQGSKPSTEVSSYQILLTAYCIDRVFGGCLVSLRSRLHGSRQLTKFNVDFLLANHI